MTFPTETVAEVGRGTESLKWTSGSTWVWIVSGLTGDGTVEPKSRDQTVDAYGDQNKIAFPRSIC